MKDYKAYFIIAAEPEIIYQALTNPYTIQLWTGEKAEMEETIGFEFSMWDGSIVGKNIDFESGKKIVQEWYFDEKEPNSIVTMKLHPHKKGTSLEIVHTNIPEMEFESIKDGWENVYMKELEDFYKE